MLTQWNPLKRKRIRNGHIWTSCAFWFVFWMLAVILCFRLFINNKNIQTAFKNNILLSLSGNLGHLTCERLQQPQEQRHPVLHMHAGSFRVSVIHRTLTWSTGSLMCVRDHSYACVHTDSESAQHFFLCFWWVLNLGSLDLDSDALPTGPPRHPFTTWLLYIKLQNNTSV